MTPLPALADRPEEGRTFGADRIEYTCRRMV